MKALVKRGLRGLGVNVTKVTGARDLKAFVDLLRPVPIETPLIRAGGAGDGGYLIPDDLDGVRACFSPGVDRTATFEEDMAARGMDCFLADLSVDRPPVANPRFNFIRKFIGDRNDEEFIRLEDWVAECAPPGDDLILQMDIEGAEYAALIDTPRQTLRRFRIVVLELHGLGLLAREGWRIHYASALAALAHEFVPVHLHPNNCCGVTRARGVDIPNVLEATFLRRDRLKPGGAAPVFPHPLDAPCAPGRPDIALPASWR